ncbi:MAG TPA: Rne/Rng family ribonuclease [Jiangellales bacterium]|nr:Rne/Rng family ribonuclease [Jiangellales bacterium]
MVDNDPQVTGEAGTTSTTSPGTSESPATHPRRRRAASRPAGPPAPAEATAGATAASEADRPAVEGSAAAPPKAAKATRARTRKAAPKAGAAPSDDASATEAAASEAAATEAAATEAAASEAAAPKRRRRVTKATAAPSAETPPAETSTAEAPTAEASSAETPAAEAPTERVPDPSTPRRRSRRRAAAPTAETAPAPEAVPPAESKPAAEAAPPAAEPTAGSAPAPVEPDAADVPPPPRKRTRRASKAAGTPAPAAAEASEGGAGDAVSAEVEGPDGPAAGGSAFQSPVFQAPQFTVPERAVAAIVGGDDVEAEDVRSEGADAGRPDEGSEDEDREEAGTRRRRRRRGGRGRRKDGAELGEGQEDGAEPTTAESAEAEPVTGADAEPETEESDTDEGAAGGSRRRRRRRRRRGESDDEPDEPNTVVRIREPRPRGEVADEVTGLKGSTRLEAKKQRRREGREAGRRRPPIVSEAEFLARRESVDRVMVVRRAGGRTQIAVLEDGVLVEHYVSREQQQSMIGNVYLGKVQNVLPAMEAAFVDIGRGRNAVLYAGEVDWAGLGLSGGPKRIEEALKSGQSVLVQVSKDPVGHKGARLTSQVSLPGRYLVYVPGGSMSGISRKLPDTERDRLKRVLKQVVPDDAGVIVRTAAEGASEEELTRDVARLTAQWEDISTKTSSGSAPQLLYGEPDLTIKVVRDLFNEDFAKLVVAGDEAWETVEPYVSFVAPSLADRLERWVGTEDVFTHYRVDEQIAKALDRKVWLPSGGSLVIDRTEAMTVVDVNTGKFTGSGGNLEQTVTKNNLEAAEEVVRQLRLRDIGGIIVIDFIDMVLESNRDLVLRRLVECLGRDRTKHQVAEVTSLGLVQMTRKKIGTGLVEAFSETCEHCKGRGVIVRLDQAGSASSGDPTSGGSTPAGPAPAADGDGGRPARRRRGGRSARSAGGAPPTEAAREATAEPASAGA